MTLRNRLKTTALHNHKHIFPAVLLLLIFLLVSCSKDNSDPNIIYNLDDEFVIQPLELLSRDGNKLSLKVQSVQPDICSAAEIVFDYAFVDGVSVIKLNDLVNPPGCAVSNLAPTKEIELANSNPNTFLLNVTLKDFIENIGEIKEFDNRYELSMNTANGLRVVNGQVLKVKENMFWGGVDFNSSDSTFAAEAFMDEVNDLITDNSLSLGHFGHFEYRNGLVDILNDHQTTTYRLKFAYQSDISQGQMVTTLNKYRNLYPDIRFFAYNGFGESL